ncbi:MAG: hypothetical protein GQ574_20790 [Crocinitomix sp.]|nr:hypothetical protein [Crocinitomix sp.]
MKIGILITLLIALTLSCNKNRDFKKKNWTKIVVPDAGVVYSMNGDIDSEFIIGGNGAIRKSTDTGETWPIVKHDITAYDLITIENTLFAISLYNESYADFYSLDQGDNWIPSLTKSLEDKRSNEVITSTGIIYKIVKSQTYPASPDSVLKSTDNGETWTAIFPFKHLIYSIYLDDFDRLYLGINGWEWDSDNNSFDSNTGDNAAIIYYLN